MKWLQVKEVTCSSILLILFLLLLPLSSVSRNKDQKGVIPVTQNEDLQLPSHWDFLGFGALKQKGHSLCRDVWWCWKQSASKARALLMIGWSRYSSLKLYRVIAQLQGNATVSKQLTMGMGEKKTQTHHALITIKATLIHFQNNTLISPATLITNERN